MLKLPYLHGKDQRFCIIYGNCFIELGANIYLSLYLPIYQFICTFHTQKSGFLIIFWSNLVYVKSFDNKIKKCLMMSYFDQELGYSPWKM